MSIHFNSVQKVEYKILLKVFAAVYHALQQSFDCFRFCRKVKVTSRMISARNRGNDMRRGVPYACGSGERVR